MHNNCVNLEAIWEVTYSSPVSIEVCDNDYFMTSIQQTLRKLIYMAFNSTNVWIEEVRHHATEKFEYTYTVTDTENKVWLMLYF